MAKFGLFTGSVDKPSQTFDGEKIFVVVNHPLAVVEIRDAQNKSIAFVRLGEGQCVKEIK
jgi:hypothetical protein